MKGSHSADTPDNIARVGVFSREELGAEPLKWLKYLLLDRAGVESIGIIASQIHRFSLQDCAKAKEWARAAATKAGAEGVEFMIVAKLVPWNTAAQLRNYRIGSLDDLETQFAAIQKDGREHSCQLWLCESSVGRDHLNLGGRITFPGPNGQQQQTLELVWFASPRMVENVGRTGFAYPYLRAIRKDSVTPFRIVDLQSSEKYRAQLSNEAMVEDYRYILSVIARREASMRRLLDAVWGFGAKEACFCFKMIHEVLTIIDWDSEIESSQT